MDGAPSWQRAAEPRLLRLGVERKAVSIMPHGHRMDDAYAHRRTSSRRARTADEEDESAPPRLRTKFLADIVRHPISFAHSAFRERII